MILFNAIFPEGSPLKDLTVGSSKVKFVKLGDNLLYDTQEEVIYEEPSILVSYNNIYLAAKGETAIPSISALQSWARIGYSERVYNQTDIIDYIVKYSVNTGSEGFELDSSNGYVTCTNNNTSSSREFKVDVNITMALSGDEKTETVTFIQEASKQHIEYSSWNTKELVNSASSSTISAKGGDVIITTIAKQEREVYTYLNDTLIDTTIEIREIEVSPSYTISGEGFIMEDNIVTAKNRSTSIGNARTATITATYEEITSTITLTQEGNYVVELNLTEGSLGYNNFAARGETLTPSTNIAKTITYIFTSGDSTTTTPNGGAVNKQAIFSMNSVTGFTLNNTSTGQITTTNNISTSTRSTSVTKTETITWTHTDTYGGNSISKSGTNECIITQNAGSIEYIINDVRLQFTAAKATKTPSVTYDTYWNGIRTNQNTSLSGYTLTETSDSYNAFTTNGTSVTASANKKMTSRTATYTISKSGYTGGTLTCTQSADELIDSYTEYNIDFSANPTTIEAAGGTSKLSYSGNYITTNTWLSGDVTTTEGTFTPTITGNATGFSLSGNTVTAEKNTSLNSRSVTYTASYSGATSKSVTITQKAAEDYIVTYGTPTISIGDGMTAKGGSATVTASVTNTYASGTKKAGTVTLKITSNGNSRFSLSGNTLSHSNMGTTTSESVTVTAYNAGNTSKTASATKTITNSVDYSTVKGINLSSFSYPEATTSANYSINPSIGNVTVSLQDTYQSGSTGSTYNLSNVTAYTKSFAIGSIQYFDIDTSSGKCTTKSANSTSSIRSTTVTLTITLTGNYQGTKTASFNTTIYQAATTNYKATIYYTPPLDSEGWIITNSTITPTSSPGSAEQGSYQILNFKAGEPLIVDNYQGNLGTVAIGSEAYVYVYVDGAWNLVGLFTHKNENYTVYI